MSLSLGKQTSLCGQCMSFSHLKKGCRDSIKSIWARPIEIHITSMSMEDDRRYVANVLSSLMFKVSETPLSPSEFVLWQKQIASLSMEDGRRYMANAWASLIVKKVARPPLSHSVVSFMWQRDKEVIEFRVFSCRWVGGAITIICGNMWNWNMTERQLYIWNITSVHQR